MFSSRSKEQQAPLCQLEDMLKKILGLAETVKQNTSSLGQKYIEDEIETLQSEHRSLEEKLENVKQKKENIFSEALELKDDLMDGIQMENKTDRMLKREMQITSDTPIAAEEGTTTAELRECLEMHNVSIFPDSNDSGGLVRETPVSQMPFVYFILYCILLSVQNCSFQFKHNLHVIRQSLLWGENVCRYENYRCASAKKPSSFLLQ